MNANEARTADTAMMHEHKTELNACCGGPAPASTTACCAEDAAVKVAGGAGCGCGAPAVEPARPKITCCIAQR